MTGILVWTSFLANYFALPAGLGGADAGGACSENGPAVPGPPLRIELPRNVGPSVAPRDYRPFLASSGDAASLTENAVLHQRRERIRQPSLFPNSAPSSRPKRPYDGRPSATPDGYGQSYRCYERHETKRVSAPLEGGTVYGVASNHGTR